jgi:hypothetical protein
MTPTANTFEDRLLDALLDRFDVTAHQPAVHPEFGPRRSNIRRGAVAVGCLGAAAALIVALEPSGSAPTKPIGSAGGTAQSTIPTAALAAWTSAPTPAAPTQVAAAEDNCAGSFGQAAGSEQGSGDKAGPQEAGGPWTPELVDTRGDLTLTLYSNSSQLMTCLDGPSFVLISNITGTSTAPAADNSATLDYVRIRGGSSSDGYTLAAGRVGSGVSAVALQRIDGSVVDASVGDGHFIAWWPDDEGVSALSVTTASGTQSYPVDPSFQKSGSSPANSTVHQLPGSADQ